MDHLEPGICGKSPGWVCEWLLVCSSLGCKKMAWKLHKHNQEKSSFGLISLNHQLEFFYPWNEIFKQALAANQIPDKQDSILLIPNLKSNLPCVDRICVYLSSPLKSSPYLLGVKLYWWKFSQYCPYAIIPANKPGKNLREKGSTQWQILAT